jgi:hypothetical protein
MAFYHINPKPLPDGNFEVHQEGCGLLVPDPERIDLGSHTDPATALAKAETYHPNKVVMCVHCGGGK